MERNPPSVEVLGGYRNWLFRVAQSLTDDISLHEDLMQEGWLAMVQAFPKFDPAKGSLPSWLTTAALMHMRDVLRQSRYWGANRTKRKFLTTPFDLDSHDYGGMSDVESEAIRNADAPWLKDRIFRAVCSLPQNQRKYVLLRFYEDCDSAQLAQIFGYNPSTLWRGARKNLRRALVDLK